MRVAVGCDHGGLDFKESIKKHLESNGVECIDLGTYTIDGVDYPDIAELVCKQVKNREVDYGILVCRTGTGMAISANKIRGIRCAKVFDEDEAKLAREHNNANCLAFSSIFDITEAYKIVDVFINTDFSDSERHHRRVDKIRLLEENNEL